MHNFKYIWIVGLAITIFIVVTPIVLFVVAAEEDAPTDDPWANVKTNRNHTDHTDLIEGPFETGSDVTRTCLNCHAQEGKNFMQTVHWTWKGDPVEIEGHDEPIAIGKSNLINNFCIGIQSNWAGCTTCHAGYGWDSADFDFSNVENVDCLVCHAQNSYGKTKAGLPAEGTDLVAAAQSVSYPNRVNCGSCHFNGGGGNAVKHGDLDQSLYFPTENVDVHMGELDFICIDCHQTEDHRISGRAISVSVDDANQIYCTNCHEQTLHGDDRINAHTDTVACQTCHVPATALREATKVYWDWSTAGQDIGDNPHEYLKIKGSFIYEEGIIPEYDWFNGTVSRYLLGDIIDPDQPTILNEPHGDINDPTAMIYPFKIHRANQPYDVVNHILLQPTTVGEGGYWTTFDWDSALEMGAEAIGLDYSGEYGFAPTQMYWVQSHMVQPAENALQCTDCHGENGRMDWYALGYNGDPMTWGGR